MSDQKKTISEIGAALLTGGADRPYAFGLGTALMPKGVALDVIGSDELDCPEFRGKPGVNFLNLRGDQRAAGIVKKLLRVSIYYGKLIRYAATSKPKIFHILWNNKIEWFDRTLLMLYYRLLGKKIVLTAHNVNAGIRDSNDTFLNRLTLGTQYRLAENIFVHTEKMKQELAEEYGVEGKRISVIPFGINNAVPKTSLTPAEARQRLSIGARERTILFFGNIAPYKGLEYLTEAFRRLVAKRNDYRLIIAGRPKNCEKYWKAVREAIGEEERNGRVLIRSDYIPDEETEVFFKAADVLVLPYRHIYQSGVLFLGHSFGVPVIAADVGSLKDDIVDGKTGFVCKPEDPADLADVLERYFASDLYANLESRRQEIQDFAEERHSWDVVAETTMSVYAGLLHLPFAGRQANLDVPGASLDAS